MRERIAGAFVLMALVLITLVVTIRVYTLQDFLSDQKLAQQREQATLIAAVLTDRVEAGEPVDRSLLAELVGAESRLEYSAGRRDRHGRGQRLRDR